MRESNPTHKFIANDPGCPQLNPRKIFGMSFRNSITVLSVADTNPSEESHLKLKTYPVFCLTI